MNFTQINLGDQSRVHTTLENLDLKIGSLKVYTKQPCDHGPLASHAVRVEVNGQPVNCKALHLTLDIHHAVVASLEFYP